jgi:hypothetical protein
MLELKKKIESFYGINILRCRGIFVKILKNIKLYFESNFLKFPEFVNQKNYDQLIFEEPSYYFKKVIIKNVQNKSVFCMDNNRKPFFNSNKKLDVRKYIWYITLIGDEITLFSNGSYLGADINSKKATGEEFMKTYENSYKFEKINNNEYLIYYKDKNNVLTVNGTNAILQKENSNRSNQKFRLVEGLDTL